MKAKKQNSSSPRENTLISSQIFVIGTKTWSLVSPTTVVMVDNYYILDIWALFGFYAAQNCSFVPKSSLNVGTELPLHAA